jgi:hypothetical protein
MILSVTALAVLVGTATLVTTLVPVVLVIFWIRDWLRGELW